MAIDVIMPKLGESITEGTILEWKKNIGDMIDKDETLLEISTDKVDSEVPCPAAGKVIEILYKVNDVVAVGEVIARVGGEGDSVKDTPSENNNSESEENSKEQIEEESLPNIDLEKPKEDTGQAEHPSSSRFYSPLVKSIAKKEDIALSELESISGSGANNRVNKNDILNYIKNRSTSTIEDTSKEVVSLSESLNNKIEPMDHVRKVIAQHMVKSRETSVHVYSSLEVDMTDIVAYRNQNKEQFNEKNNTPLTYTPFIIDASIKAVQEYPLMNAYIDGDNVQHNQNINIGVAVALPNNNLIVPVISRSEELNFLGIARATNDLAVRARNNKLDPNEAKGSTFTVTNPGVFGSLFGMGIINQPNVGLLSVGSIHKRPVVKETEYGDIVVVRSMMYLTLAYDHRLIDGAYGTQFLNRIKELLESFTRDSL